MDVTVSARHTEVSDALREAAVEKIGRLSRYLEGMDRAEVHFSEQGNPRIAERLICEVVLEGHGHFVRAKVTAADGLAAIDKAVAKLEQQLHKLKTKLQRRRTAAPPAAPDASVAAPAAVDADAEADEGPRIVKTKRYELKPMLPDEAALQLDLLGHDFYFFTNAETGRAAVLYRRADGDLGLIDESD